jgi:hypothetical protein
MIFYPVGQGRNCTSRASGETCVISTDPTARIGKRRCQTFGNPNMVRRRPFEIPTIADGAIPLANIEA